MEIPAVSATTLRRARDGKWMWIDKDVCDIARRLKELDESLRVRWSDTPDKDTGKPGFYVVYREVERNGETRHELVLTTTELDARVIDRVREITSPGYDYVGELDRIDAEHEKRLDNEFSEKIGERGERLAHALRKDTGHKGRIFLPGES